MKEIVNNKIILTFLVSIVFCLSSVGQEIKIGYVNLNSIFANMPEMKVADSLSAVYKQSLQETLTAKYQEYQVKLASYQEKEATMDEVNKKSAQKELQDMKVWIEEISANSNQVISQKNQSLFEPIQQNVIKAIKKIATDKGYTYVFSLDGKLVYASREEDDLTNNVVKEMGFSLGN